MLLPEALCGIASVLLLHSIARRTLGHRAALLAALMLALTPIFVAVYVTGPSNSAAGAKLYYLAG